MRFRFSLQPLLDRATHREKAAAHALARVVAERSRETAGLLGCAIGRDELSAAPLAAGLHLEALARLRITRARRLAEIDTEIERLRGELAVGFRERRSLELLRDRRHAEFERARERAEELELEEINAAIRSA